MKLRCVGMGSATFLPKGLAVGIGFFPVEFPAVQLPAAAAQAALHKCVAFLRQLLTPCQLFQVVAHGLVKAFAHFAGSFAGVVGHALVDGQGDVHCRLLICMPITHIMCAHGKFIKSMC